jgi:hypothetical protein
MLALKHNKFQLQRYEAFITINAYAKSTKMLNLYKKISHQKVHLTRFFAYWEKGKLKDIHPIHMTSTTRYSIALALITAHYTLETT